MVSYFLAAIHFVCVCAYCCSDITLQITTHDLFAIKIDAHLFVLLHYNLSVVPPSLKPSPNLLLQLSLCSWPPLLASPPCPTSKYRIGPCPGLYFPYNFPMILNVDYVRALEFLSLA